MNWWSYVILIMAVRVFFETVYNVNLFQWPSRPRLWRILDVKEHDAICCTVNEPCSVATLHVYW